MARRVGLRTATPVGWVLGCGSLVACSAIFGIDEPDARDDSAPSAGSETGGTNSSGAAGKGGRDGIGGVAGDASGIGGIAGGGLGGRGGGASGDSGAGGEGGVVDPGPTLGEPCDAQTEPQTACTMANPRLVLKCDDKIWDVQEECVTYSACVPGFQADGGLVPAQCQAPTVNCDDFNGTICYATDLLDCETRPPDYVWRSCPYGCLDGACLPGSGDELTVHTAAIPSNLSTLPRAIAVCYLRREDEALVELVHDEVERTWGRYHDFEFTGWDVCGEDPEEGVVISFASNCRDRLMGDRVNEEPIHVEFCRSYYDANGDPHPIDEAGDKLMRLLARHQFGHVLGVGDFDHPAYPLSTMRCGISSSRIDEYELLPGQLFAGRALCGGACRKHSGAIVTTTGRCLEVTDGKVVSAPCPPGVASTPRIQGFTLLGGGLLNTAGDPMCLGPGPNDEIIVTDCGGDRFGLLRAQWNSYGRCVAPLGGSASAGTPLVTGPCLEVHERSQTFLFEVSGTTLDGLTARIHYDTTVSELAMPHYCVTVPGGVQAPNVVLELDVCDSGSMRSDQTFELRYDGAIAFGSGHCVEWPLSWDGSLYLDDTCTERINNKWLLTGPIETPEGLLLELDSNGRAMVAPNPSGAFSDNQIFDFYF